MPGFEGPFAVYIKWVLEGRPPKDKAKKDAMLKAFRKFLEVNRIPAQRRTELVEKMEHFAKGVPKRGPGSK